MRPIVRYHGGKWLIAPKIIALFPAHRIYVEPFGGAASVLLRKPRSYAEVYNDLESEIVNLFQQIRDNGEALRRALELTPYAREEFMATYKKGRKTALERARQFVIRCYMGFGSNAHEKLTGFRARSNRSGTTPSHDWMHYPSQLPEIVSRLQGVVIENRLASKVMAAHDGGDTLFYLDPPYPHDTRSSMQGLRHGGSYHHEMTDQDHRDLLDQAKTVRGHVIISTYPNGLYQESLAGWGRVEIDALADGARPRKEVLYLSPSCATAPRFQTQNMTLEV